MLVRELGEEALIAELRQIFAAAGREVTVGIGDDAAVIHPPPGLQAWTTDLLLEGIHFQAGWQTPEELGRKSLAVNLSDLAAVAAIPRFALLSLAFAPDTDTELILGLARGVHEVASEYQVAVMGGDTTASASGLLISVTAGGELPYGRPLLRSGARPGDAILVTGRLGSAAAGLRLLQQHGAEGFPALRRAFIAPQPRVDAAQLARDAGATAMTDISDGLATDLRHICSQSNVGARLYAPRLPLDPELERAAGEFGWDATRLALSGGEDYELLLTMPAESAQAASQQIAAAAGVPVSIVGEIVPPAADPQADAITLVSADGSEARLTARGFEHFRS